MVRIPGNVTTNSVIILQTPTDSSNAVTLQFLSGQIGSIQPSSNLTWLVPVNISGDTNTVTSPANGYRVLQNVSSSEFTLNSIYQYYSTTTSWSAYVPVIGNCVMCEDTMSLFTFNGTNWIAVGKVTGIATDGSINVSSTQSDTGVTTYTLSLPTQTGYTPGAFSLANLTVDKNGRVTAISSTPVVSPLYTNSNGLNVHDASPSQDGTVNTGIQSFAGAKTITDTTASSSTSTGALVVSGGVGIGGNVNIGGIATFTNVPSSPNGPVNSTDITNKGYVDNKVTIGTTFLEPVTGTADLTALTTMVSGNRYIHTGATGTYTTNSIYTYTTSWALTTTPSEGDVVFNDSANSMLIFTSGGSWTNFAIAVDHHILLDLTGHDDHTQYMLVGGQRTTDTAAVSINGVTTFNSVPNMASGLSPVNAQDLATKNYVDSAIPADITVATDGTLKVTSAVSGTNTTYTVALPAQTGYTAGAFMLPSISVDQDGRVIAIKSTPVISPLYTNSNGLNVYDASPSQDGTVSTGIQSFAGAKTITDTTASSSSTTGALVVSGGAGIGGNAYIGGTVYPTNGFITTSPGGPPVAWVPGSASPVANTIKFGDGSGWVFNFNQSGGSGSKIISLQDNGNISTIGQLTSTSTIGSSSTSTGALVVTGGAGIGGNAYIGGTVYPTNGFITPCPGTPSTVNWVPGSAFPNAFSVQFGNGQGWLFNFQNSNGSNLIQLRDDGTYIGIGQINTSNTNYSSSTTTGALVIAGGAGIGGNVNLGGSVNAALNVNAVGSVNANSMTSTNGITAGSVTSSGAITAGGQVNITNSTSSTSSTTGALAVTGGVGIGGNLNVGGNLGMTGGMGINGTVTIANSYNSLGPALGALVVTGGVGIGGNLNVGGNLGMSGSTTLDGQVNITNSTSSTSNTTGALVVTGGAGIGGEIYAGSLMTPTILAQTITSGSFVYNGSSAWTGNFSDGLNTVPANMWWRTICGIVFLTVYVPGYTASSTSNAPLTLESGDTILPDPVSGYPLIMTYNGVANGTGFTKSGIGVSAVGSFNCGYSSSSGVTYGAGYCSDHYFTS